MSYSDIALPTPRVVIGQRLVPFTFGHAVLLEQHGLYDIRSPKELIMAVSACCQPASKFASLLESRLSRMKLRIWAWRVGRSLRKVKDRWKSACDAFADYLLEANKWPDYTPERSGSDKGSKTPNLQRLRITLISKCGYSPHKIDDVPLQQCIWDFVSFLELEGEGTVRGENYGEFDEMMFKEAEKSAELFGIKKPKEEK